MTKGNTGIDSTHMGVGRAARSLIMAVVEIQASPQGRDSMSQSRSHIAQQGKDDSTNRSNRRMRRMRRGLTTQ